MEETIDDATGAALKAIQCLESVDRGVSVHPDPEMQPILNSSCSAVLSVSAVLRNVRLLRLMMTKKARRCQTIPVVVAAVPAWVLVRTDHRLQGLQDRFDRLHDQSQ